jgi:hypothetical protein
MFTITRVIGARKLSLLILAASIYFILYHLPPPPKTQNNTRADRKPPKYDVETTPRYLHQSPFRDDPDSEYESKISNALLDIERKTVQGKGYDSSAEDRIWQIMLGKYVDRGDDSLSFEEENSEWQYSVGPS